MDCCFTVKIYTSQKKYCFNHLCHTPNILRGLALSLCFSSWIWFNLISFCSLNSPIMYMVWIGVSLCPVEACVVLLQIYSVYIQGHPNLTALTLWCIHDCIRGYLLQSLKGSLWHQRASFRLTSVWPLSGK